MVDFARNASLDRAFDELLERNDYSFRERVAAHLVLWLPRKRLELERAVTELALTTGAIPPQACEGGRFQGNWEDLLDWLWEHREEILSFILTIISLL